MYAEKDSTGRISLCDMTISQAETIAIALARVVEQLPKEEQIRFRRLLIDLDTLIQRQ